MTTRARIAVEGRMRRTPFLIAIVATWLAAAPVAAHPLLARDWHDLSPKERYDSIQNYWQHERLPQERQHDIEQHYERWRSMPPNERNRVRQNYERFRQLPPHERERFQRKYEKWKQQGDAPH